MRLMRVSELPHNKNSLLPWSYRLLKDWSSVAHYALCASRLCKRSLRQQDPRRSMTSHLTCNELRH